MSCNPPGYVHLLTLPGKSDLSHWWAWKKLGIYNPASSFLCSKSPHREHMLPIDLRETVSLVAKTFAQWETYCLGLWPGGKSISGVPGQEAYTLQCQRYWWYCLLSALLFAYFLIGSGLGWGEWVFIKAMQIPQYNLHLWAPFSLITTIWDKHFSHPVFYR